MKETPQRAWFVYLLECRNGAVYTGITTDVEKRFAKHAAGTGAKFTKRNPPSHVLAFKLCKDRSEASKLEWTVKQLRPEQKRSVALAWGDGSENGRGSGI